MSSMKITPKTLSIPPYISTTWENISSLHARPSGGLLTLVVVLKNQTQVEVPNLDKRTIDEIFESHARYANERANAPVDSPFTFSVPMNSDLLESGNISFQHNPEQAGLPPLKPEVLNKILMITRAFGLEEFFSKAEEGCHCMYCQLARHHQSEEGVEEVTPEDLHFRDWEIENVGHQIYRVTNPLDSNEHYEVFLGTPIGCTCGHQKCEHVAAVLKS